MISREVLQGYRVRKIGNLIRDLDAMYKGDDPFWLEVYIDEIMNKCLDEPKLQQEITEALEGMIATAKVILR